MKQMESGQRFGWFKYLIQYLRLTYPRVKMNVKIGDVSSFEELHTNNCIIATFIFIWITLALAPPHATIM